MRNPAMWVGIFAGGVLTVMLLMYRFKAAIVTGILLVSIISWPRTTALTYFPYTETGNDAFDFFRKVVDFHQISKTLTVQEWDISQHGSQFGLALITFLYVDILDTTGTLVCLPPPFPLGLLSVTRRCIRSMPCTRPTFYIIILTQGLLVRYGSTSKRHRSRNRRL